MSTIERSQAELAATAKNGDMSMSMRKGAIEELTDRELLTEIIKGSESNNLYEWREFEKTRNGNVIVNRSLDLRDTARERLKELDRKDSPEDQEDTDNIYEDDDDDDDYDCGEICYSIYDFYD